MSKMVIRIIVGLVFIVAAVMKLLTIDNFELYIYSFNIFGYGLTTVFSRLLIAAEILMGLGMILKIYYKEIWSLTMLAFIGFTLFLIYVVIFRNDDNCHCFGDLIRLDPAESILKNLVSMALLLFIRKEDSHIYKPRLKKWLIGLSIAVAVILPFVVFPMDTIYNMIASKDNNINTVGFDEIVKGSDDVFHLELRNDAATDSTYIYNDTITQFNIANDKYIINFITSGCRFCKMGAKKLMMIANHNDIDHRHIKFLVWGYEADIVEFMNETETADCDFWFIHPTAAINITYGKFPVYVWTDNETVVNSGDLRDLDEGEITKFLK